MLVEVFIKNMVCNRCIKVVKNELLEAGVAVIKVELGRVVYKSKDKTEDAKKLKKVLLDNDFELLESTDKILVENVKLNLIRLLENLPIQKNGTLSSYLSRETNYEYSRLSRTFSHIENTTLEKYFIKLKIEKTKELIQSKQYNFTQISQLLDYSSVNHLSRQFKAETGINLTEYKTLEKNFRNPLDQIL
ncbi:helix-turn-helix domain-containing protein [Haloflavibacter putidus]|uniref:Helix-turn-helix domain-containing protein n=1 Tax=Haloflavibacter putidus TaxID=2576776 RepID=A0A507ZIC2_9FLAO|nr:AraC family transcriptional regulator [Haloflavibacter putidus]TQD36263.1 helix-turn-helix domain-containing protein [Haloflavibacter putidus]